MDIFMFIVYILTVLLHVYAIEQLEKNCQRKENDSDTLIGCIPVGNLIHALILGYIWNKKSGYKNS